MVDQQMEKALVFIERGVEWLINTVKKASDWAKVKLSAW